MEVDFGPDKLEKDLSNFFELTMKRSKIKLPFGTLILKLTT